MLQITTPRAPVWREPLPGLRFQLRFGPTEARFAAQRYVRDVLEEDKTADTSFAFVIGCLLWGVVAWEGVAAALPDGVEPDADADPVWADLTPENLIAVLRQSPDVFDDLDAFYVGEIIGHMAERKKSPPSPSGTSAAAPATAPDATGPADATADTKPTAPSPKPAPGSGG